MMPVCQRKGSGRKILDQESEIQIEKEKGNVSISQVQKKMKTCSF